MATIGVGDMADSKPKLEDFERHVERMKAGMIEAGGVPADVRITPKLAQELSLFEGDMVAGVEVIIEMGLPNPYGVYVT